MATKKKTPKTSSTQEGTQTALESVGRAALDKTGVKTVFVTSDGQAFLLESDAKNHAQNLKDKDILTVSSKSDKPDNNE